MRRPSCSKTTCPVGSANDETRKWSWKKRVYFSVWEDVRVLQGELKIKGPVNGKGALTLGWLIWHECQAMWMFRITCDLMRWDSRSSKVYKVTVSYISRNLTKLWHIFWSNSKNFVSLSMVCACGLSILTILFWSKQLNVHFSLFST